MAYSDEVKEEVRSRNDIVDVISSYVALKKRGGVHVGLCPFHHESTPSFTVYQEKQNFHCYGCGAGGDVFGFLMRRENMEFNETVKFLADRARYDLPEYGANSADYAKKKEARARILEANTAAARFYYETLGSQAGKDASDYLDRREIAAGARRKFGLGYAPRGGAALYEHLLAKGFDSETLTLGGLAAQINGRPRDRFVNRLMFPIFDVRGQVVGFGGRILDDGQPKYLNSSDTPVFDKGGNLYGINYARKEGASELLLVEGYMDVIALYQAGTRNVAAALGTAFGRKHAELLKKYFKSALLLFDSDAAGEAAVLRALPILREAGVPVRVLRLEGAKDPDEFIHKYGKEAFGRARASAPDGMSFELRRLRGLYDFDSPVEKSAFTNEAAKLLAAIANPIEREIFTGEVAVISGVSEQTVSKEVSKIAAEIGHIPSAEYKNTPSFTVSSKTTKGIDEARRNIIYISGTNPAAAAAIRRVLPSFELFVPFYIRMYERLLSLYDAGAGVITADLTQLFETAEEQDDVSRIFNIPFTCDGGDLLKALNDQLHIIKRAYCDEMIGAASENGDMRGLQDYSVMKRALKGVYIDKI